MRSTTALVLASLTLAVAACGGGDESATITVPGAPEIEPVDCGVEPPAERVIPEVAPPEAIPTELVVTDLTVGTGPKANAGDTLYVDYTGIRSEDGTVFDTSYPRGRPLDFVLGRGGVIAGWDDGLLGVQAGGLRRLDIPAEQAYGDNPPGDEIQPGDALTFLIEVRAIAPEVSAEDAPLDLEVPPSVGATEVGIDDIVVGDGEVAQLGDTVIVHALLVRGDNEVVLLDTWQRQEPFRVELTVDSAAIRGLAQGLQCARVGTRRVLTLPPEWAFGPGGEPGLGLPADTDLIVIADVVGRY